MNDAPTQETGEDQEPMPDAAIYLFWQDGGLKIDVATAKELPADHPTKLFAHFVGRNSTAIAGLCMDAHHREQDAHEAGRKNAQVQAVAKQVIEGAARRLVGPDGKLLS